METFGIQHVRTSLYHPQSNSMVEGFHRPLKTSVTAQRSPHWTLRLPVVLLALHNTIKLDIERSPAEMFYGMLLRFPGEFFHPTPLEAHPPKLVNVLQNAMAQLRATPSTNHAIHELFSFQKI